MKKIPVGIHGWLPNGEDSLHWSEEVNLGLSFAVKLVPWCEDTEGVYTWMQNPENDRLYRLLTEYRKLGFKVQLVESTVHMDHKHLPQVVGSRRFNDRELLKRWEAYLTAFFDRYGSLIDYFSIGNEVSSYFCNNKDEWKDYLVFFRHGAELIRKLKPVVKIGIVHAQDTSECYWEDLKPYCDYFGFNYYVPNATNFSDSTADALQPDHPMYFEKVFERAFGLAAGKPLLISEVGCATHPSIKSSPEVQAQFIRQLFQWLRNKEDMILAMVWECAADWPYESTQRVLRGFLSDDYLDSEIFMRFLTSLGLKYENGTPKPGYEVFKEELRRYQAT